MIPTQTQTNLRSLRPHLAFRYRFLRRIRESIQPLSGSFLLWHQRVPLAGQIPLITLRQENRNFKRTFQARGVWSRDQTMWEASGPRLMALGALGR